MVDPDSVTELTNILIKKDDEISQLKAQVTSLTKENESLVYVNRQEVEEKIAPFKVVWEKEIEELKAQVEGLVEALIKVDGHRGTPVGYETHLCRYCGSNHYGANMWVGKALRDEQIAMGGDSTDQPNRTNI